MSQKKNNFIHMFVKETYLLLFWHSDVYFTEFDIIEK